MKKFTCLFLTILILASFQAAVSSETESPWESEYRRIVTQLEREGQMEYILADFDYDGFPELVAGDETSVSVFTFKNDFVMKTSENKNIPFIYFENLKTAQNNLTNFTEFIGQALVGTDTITYKIKFSDGAADMETIATEHSDNTGTFKGDGSNAVNVPDCAALVSTYLADYSIKPFVLCVLTTKEIEAAETADAAFASFFQRYKFLSALSDDTSDFSTEQREAMKTAVGGGSFLQFEKISRLSGSELFVQFYADETAGASSMIFPYSKKYAVVANTNSEPEVLALYGHESELDTAYLLTLKTEENNASNLYIDYTKSTTFRGIDDYVNYLSAVFSSLEEAPNENGKKAISEYMEYAVNRSSRTEIKPENNVVFVSCDTVSFISENAVDCMGRFNKLCESQGISLSRKPRIIPELVCANIDLQKPVRIEYEKGVSQNLAGASGIRLKLDDTHGIYITASDLATLENAIDLFCIELKIDGDMLSVVFTDKNNQTIDYISAPVWFISPAESEYSTVMASFKGGTDNWGGQFDPQHKTIEFSTNYSGDYDIVENDITINDIGSLPSNMKEAIRFMVSKGIFSLDRQNNFNPDETLSRYDFTTALVKMFYALNVDAESSFKDIPATSEIYRYVASAEALNIAEGYADGMFHGDDPVSKEQMITLCGRTLVEKKGYTYPENDEAYFNFADADAISQWAKPDIAVAVQCGLISNTGIFSPAGSVTRAEGAEILYKTFMLLYDVSPVATISSPQAEETAAVTFAEPVDFEFRAAICIVVTILLLFVSYILVKIKKRKKT